MSFALSAGVTGLQAHQKMLDIAGNNLANVNTTAYKASRITFSELLSETIKKASQPTATIGGTNPQQMGSGVGVAGISPNMSQGNIVNTGNPLDMAMEGEGYFVLSDGSQNVYTRAGTFEVDANSNLVDPSSGYIVQRIGSVGESDTFQTAGNTDVGVPYDVAMAASGTTEVTLAGNLSSDAVLATVKIQKLTSNLQFTTGSSTAAVATDEISDLDQYTEETWANGTITFSGYKPDGTTLALATPATDLTLSVTATTTLQDVLDYLNTDDGLAVSEVQELTPNVVATADHFHLTYGGSTTGDIAWDADVADIVAALNLLPTVTAGDIAVGGEMINDGTGGVEFTFLNTLGDVGDITFDFSGITGPTNLLSTLSTTTTGRAMQGMLGSESAATLVNGKLVITDTASGYSESDLAMAWSDSNLTLPGYFEITTVGGEEVKNVSINVHDSLGGAHTLAAAFVRTDTENTWDMVLTSISGNISAIDISGLSDRRIKGIEFDATDGFYSGLNSATGDTAQFEITFAHDASNPQTISINLGTSGQLNGLTQFAGGSTAVAREQDGYEAGRLSTVSVNNEGVLIGAFSNGIKKNIAALQVALFQNSSALEGIGSGYFVPSANSGEAVATQAMTGGAGSIHGGALERSNADVATEFVNMIQAQNGFQANARTIRVANEILRELTSLIR